jgi:hypothetical protein
LTRQVRAPAGARANREALHMGYRIRKGLHWCECSGRIVLLDMLEDRYSCLSRGASGAFLRLASGAMQAGDLEQLEPLVAGGLLVDDPANGSMEQSSRIPAALGDHVEEPDPSAAIADLCAAIRAQLRWAILLKLRRLAHIVKSIERPAAAHAMPPGDADQLLQRLISAFASASLLIPAADRCLVRAFAFRAICMRRGIRPQLVFGVRLNPFHAHCWVQLDRRVLIGDFEQVCLFTPIAAIG